VNLSACVVSAASLALPLALLVGCSSSNARNDIGGGHAGFAPGDGVRLPALGGVPPTDARATRDPAEGDRPPLAMDRSNWRPVVFLVPQVGTAGSPSYAPATRWEREPGDSASRERGEFPHALSALELSRASYWTIAAESWASGPLALYDLGMMPYRAIRDSDDHWRQPEVRGPLVPYARAPQWTARGVAPDARRADEAPVRQSAPITPGTHADTSTEAAR
jgi:hypothetical protein